GVAACSRERAAPVLEQRAGGLRTTGEAGPMGVEAPGADAAAGATASAATAGEDRLKGVEAAGADAAVGVTASAATGGAAELTRVLPLRPGPGDVDRAVLLRLRRELGLPLEV